MATHAAHPETTSRTISLLEEIAGGQRAVQLRAQVAAANRGSTPEQVEEAFQEACLRAARGCRGQTMGEVYVWLRKTTGTLLKDARERLKREVLVDHSAPEFVVADTSTPPDELVIRREEREELDALTLAILDRLCERERTIAILHSHGYQRKEIAERLGLTTRVVKRSVEDVLATGRSQLTKFTGFGCADGHQLVSRYAFGLALGREAQKAQLHLATCSRCGSMYERLDVWRERVAVLLPVPPVMVDQHAAIERVVHAGTDVIASGGRPRTGLRRHVADSVGTAREHLAGATARAVDPTPLTGMRPGAVVAAVAGCIAIGGGTTYCVKESVGPFVGFASKPMTERAAPERAKPKRARAATPTPPTAVIAQGTTARTTTSTTATAAPRKHTKPKPLPPAPEDEFEPTSAGGSSTSPITANAASSSSTGSTPQSSSPKQRPAAAPAEGPGEFDGP